MLFTVPNILTLTRLLAVPVVGILLIIDFGIYSSVSVFVIFLLASVTDYFDGYLARTLNQSTSVGRMLDPIADKAMVIIALCFLNYQPIDFIERILIGIPTLAIIFREVFVSGLREYLGVASETLQVTAVSKWKTASQMIAIGCLFAADVPVLNQYIFSELGHFLLWLATIITIFTGWDYLKKALVELEKK